MRAKFLCLGLTVAIAVALGEDMTAPRQPVLVELFTSEGCSSCPPADALLEKLDREQPVAGAQIIVLSEHVDYWNRLGWTDPYSSAAFSARQVMYARRFALESGPYTPQMVVDGSAQFVGSDPQKADAAIRKASLEPKVVIRMHAATSGAGAVALEVDPLPAGKVRKANVYLARAADSGTSDVLRGENQGRKLHHVSIVGEIQQVGSVSAHAGFHGEFPSHAAKEPGGARWIAFVQEADNGLVRGAAMFALPKAGAQ